MKLHHLSLAIALISCSTSIAAHAQGKNEIRASVFYPVSLGNNFVKDNYDDFIGMNICYFRNLSDHFSLSIEYAGSLHGQHITYTDDAGFVTHTDLSTLLIHDFDAKMLYTCSDSHLINPVFSMAIGYSILNRQFQEIGSLGRVNQSGININPGFQLNINVSERFRIFPSVSYAYRLLFIAPDPVPGTSYYQNIQALNLGLGSAVSF